MKEYLEETILLDYNSEEIQDLINIRGWKAKEPYEKINEIYEFVRNEILFGYSRKDAIKASEVLKDGLGQCNTKGILLMALLRAVGIKCRVHGFFIHKEMQKGALSGIAYTLAPKKITHAWVEVFFNDQWLDLEGVIIDDNFFNSVKDKILKSEEGYFGYAIAVKEKCNENLCWKGNSTYVQSLGITDDLGIFNSPDEFFNKYNNDVNVLKELFFNKVLRKRINKRLQRIRESL